MICLQILEGELHSKEGIGCLFIKKKKKSSLPYPTFKCELYSMEGIQ